MGEPRRFGAFSEDTMVEIMKKKNASKTDQTTEFAVNVLRGISTLIKNTRNAKLFHTEMQIIKSEQK